jgi:hypothetical protein
MAVKIQVEVFWVVMPCSVVAGYQRFGGPCCLHLQGTGDMKLGSAKGGSSPMAGSSLCFMNWQIKIL